MLHVGLDLSRKRVDVCLISGEGELVERFRSPCDRDGLYGLSRRVAVYDEPVRGVVESSSNSGIGSPRRSCKPPSGQSPRFATTSRPSPASATIATRRRLSRRPVSAHHQT